MHVWHDVVQYAYASILITVHESILFSAQREFRTQQVIHTLYHMCFCMVQVLRVIQTPYCRWWTCTIRHMNVFLLKSLQFFCAHVILEFERSLRPRFFLLCATRMWVCEIVDNQSSELIYNTFGVPKRVDVTCFSLRTRVWKINTTYWICVFKYYRIHNGYGRDARKIAIT